MSVIVVAMVTHLGSVVVVEYSSTQHTYKINGAFDIPVFHFL